MENNYTKDKQEYQLFEKDVEEIQKLRYDYMYDSTKTISEINRQLAIVGIAVSWLFVHESSIENKDTMSFISILFFVVAMVIDYIYYYIRHKIYEDYADKNKKLFKKEIINNPKDVWDIVNELPSNILSKTNRLWHARLIFVIIGYLFIVLSSNPLTWFK